MKKFSIYAAIAAMGVATMSGCKAKEIDTNNISNVTVVKDEVEKEISTEDLEKLLYDALEESEIDKENYKSYGKEEIEKTGVTEDKIINGIMLKSDDSELIIIEAVDGEISDIASALDEYRYSNTEKEIKDDNMVEVFMHRNRWVVYIDCEDNKKVAESVKSKLSEL